jgi:hypothetical protein
MAFAAGAATMIVVPAAAAATPAAMSAAFAGTAGLAAVVRLPALRLAVLRAAVLALVATATATAAAPTAPPLVFAVVALRVTLLVRRGGLGGLAAEEAFQPAEEAAGFLRGFGARLARERTTLFESRLAAGLAAFRTERLAFLASRALLRFLVVGRGAPTDGGPLRRSGRKDLELGRSFVDGGGLGPGRGCGHGLGGGRGRCFDGGRFPMGWRERPARERARWRGWTRAFRSRTGCDIHARA